MARPKKVIDKALVEKLAAIQCTTPEIAAVCGCSEDTIERRFAGTLKKGRAQGRVSLRRLQWESAQKGNTGMQVWLGKQLLGQTDHIEQRISSDVTITANIGHADSNTEPNTSAKDSAPTSYSGISGAV